MKKRFKLILVILPAIWLAVSSCKKTESNPPSDVSFSQTTNSADEGAGTATFVVNLSKASDKDITVNYSITGTAILNGDYEITTGTNLTSTVLTIPKGSTSVSLPISIIDDAVVESDKTIIITFTSVSGANLSSNIVETMTIKDNDVKPTEGVQIDLTWDVGATDALKTDLDLFLSSVNPDTTTLTKEDIYSYSGNEKGFESVLLNSKAKDGDYYIGILFFEGDQRDINLTLSFTGTITDSFTDTYPKSAALANYYVYYTTPVNKTGSVYTGRSAGARTMRVYKVSKSSIARIK